MWHERLRTGFAGCLADGLFAQGPYLPAHEGPPLGLDGIGDDERAELVLQLLLQTVDMPVPNVAHLLMGFEVHDGEYGACLPPYYLGTRDWDQMMHTYLFRP